MEIAKVLVQLSVMIAVVVPMMIAVVVPVMIAVVVPVMIVRLTMFVGGLFMVAGMVQFGEKSDHLKHEQSQTSQDQPLIGYGAKSNERSRLSPHCKKHHHDAQCGDLT